MIFLLIIIEIHIYFAKKILQLIFSFSISCNISTSRVSCSLKNPRSIQKLAPSREDCERRELSACQLSYGCTRLYYLCAKFMEQASYRLALSERHEDTRHRCARGISYSILGGAVSESLFRRMRFPLVQRSRIIKAAWNYGFCFGSMCYMQSSATQILNFAPHKLGMTYQELAFALHKSFYFHQAGIDILCCGAWMKGCVNLLFASFILNPDQQNYGCTVTSTFLLYKTIDIAIVNACRILLCIFKLFLQTIGRPICKLLFLLHCLTWMYLYLYYVPTYMLWSEEVKYARTESGLWLWFAAECLDSVWLRLIGHAKATHWLEICLFPPPTQEAIELAGIQKRHKESLRKFNNNRAKKVELWQTLVCAMAIKKKIKRIRQAKDNIDVSTEDSKKNRTV